MQERINILKNKEKNYDEILSSKEKDMIYFNSIKNFLLYIEKFEILFEQRKVIKLIEIYFTKIEENEFMFVSSQKTEIMREFVNPIAYYYQLRFRFKFFINLKYSLFIGLNIDLILWIVGALKHIYYLPIASLLLLLYWAYVKVFFVSKRKFYNHSCV